MVRRRSRQRRPRVRPPLGGRTARRGGARLAERGRAARGAHVGGGLAGGDAAGGGAGRARRRAGRPRRHLHADVPRGRGRVARVRARRRRAGADLLRLRRARDRVAPRGFRREGRALRRLVAPPRQAHRDAADARRRRPLRRRARGRVEPGDGRVAGAGDAAARERCRRSRSTPRRRICSPTPPARPGSRRARCTCRAASSSRSRARPRIRATSEPGDRVHFATDMGWIMGPWTLVGAGANGATVVLAEGAPDWPADRLWRLVESERVTMLGLSPTLVRALIPHGDPDCGPLVAEDVLHDRRAVESGSVPVAVRARRRLARADREHLRRHRGRRVLPGHVHHGADQAGRARLPGTRPGHGRRGRGRTSRSAARSASSCAGGRGRG